MATKFPKTTREQWMTRVATQLAPEFKKLGYPLPPFRVSTGFTSVGRRGKRVAECWTDRLDAERRHQIFIDPRSDDPVDVINSVAHELIHAAVGLDQGHKGKFLTVALALGMERPMTSTPSGPAFVALAKKILKKIGPYPHTRLQVGFGDGEPTKPTKPGSPGAPTDGGPVSTIVTSGPTKQGARMIKAQCDGCGYTVRLTRKWVDVAVPQCPNAECKAQGRPLAVDGV